MNCFQDDYIYYLNRNQDEYLNLPDYLTLEIT
jgi:hypothetical protein